MDKNKYNKNVSYLILTYSIVIIVIYFLLGCPSGIPLFTTETGGPGPQKSLKVDDIQFIQDLGAPLSKSWGFDGTPEPAAMSLSKASAEECQIQILNDNTVSVQGVANDDTYLFVPNNVINQGR